ncbi:MAG: hypothetical protein RSC00_05750, partial [Ruthenibacterium sp.]
MLLRNQNISCFNYAAAKTANNQKAAAAKRKFSLQPLFCGIRPIPAIEQNKSTAHRYCPARGSIAVSQTVKSI